MLRARPITEEIFNKATKGSALMTPEMLRGFFKIEQKENVEVDDCARIIRRFAKENPDGITRGEFELFLTSGVNQVCTLAEPRRYTCHLLISASLFTERL
jgi:hypothetical protein